MISAKFWDFLTPSPLVRIWDWSTVLNSRNLPYYILFWANAPSPPQWGCHIYEACLEKLTLRNWNRLTTSWVLRKLVTELEIAIQRTLGVWKQKRRVPFSCVKIENWLHNACSAQRIWRTSTISLTLFRFLPTSLCSELLTRNHKNFTIKCDIRYLAGRRH